MTTSNSRTDESTAGAEPPTTVPTDPRGAEPHAVRAGDDRRSRPVLALNPACRVLWRSPDQVQLELGAAAVLVDGVDSTMMRALLRPDDTQAVALPPSGTGAHRAVTALLDGGFLWTLHTHPDELFAPPRPRLAAELTALAVSHGAQATRTLAARRDRSVKVLGDSRLASVIATALAVSGVGRVCHTDSAATTLAHLQPGLLPARAEGRPLHAATGEAIARSAPEVTTLPPPSGEDPDLVVLAVDTPVDPEVYDGLHREALPHLHVAIDRASIVVGPLVVPGLTACLRCTDLHRLDRDPAWHALAAQLSVPSRRGQPCPAWSVTAGAGLAAGQALAYLDGTDVAVIDATVELPPGEWQTRRRRWPVHPDCECQR